MTGVKSQENNTITEEKEKESFLGYYLKQSDTLFSILVSLFIVLDVIGVIISTTFLFYEIFLYLGIIMIILAALALYFIIRDEKFIWSIIAGFIMGFIPTVEIIIHLATIKMSTLDLSITIIALLFAVGYIFAPFLMAYMFAKRKEVKK